MQRLKLKLIPFTFIALALSGAPAWASDPEPIRIGFLEVLPTIDTKVTELDSTWLPNGEEESSELLVFKPKLAAFVSDGKNQFSTAVEILNGNYSARGADTFVDLRYETAARLPIDQRNLIRLRSEFFNTHESLGSTFRNGNSSVPDRFTTSMFNGTYEYTTTEGKGRLAFDAGTFTKNYLENDNLSYRNHEDYSWGSSFYLRVLPGTDMVLQYRLKNVNYLDDRTRLSANIREQDHKESNAYLGATWEAPAIIPGELKIASGFKETATKAARASTNSARWETNVRWELLGDTVVTLNAHRIRRDETGMDAIMATTSLKYSWEYLWSGRLKSAIAGNYSGDTYLHNNRKDEGLGLKLRMDYAYSRWLNMFVAVGRDEKRSALNQFNFTQRTFMLGITATLEHLWGW